jgi:hypothetical protein
MKQIFRRTIPITILIDLLEQISLKTDKYYFIDINAYKKMMFHKLHLDFLKKIVDYYHASKQFYIERKLTYNSFTNIVRQICKSNGVTFTSQIKYNESQYNIDYFVYLISTPPPTVDEVKENI